MFRDQLLIHIPRHSLPLCRVHLVHGVDDVEGLGVFLLELVEFEAEEDVGGALVGEDEREFGGVGGGCKSVGENLVHGRAE